MKKKTKLPWNLSIIQGAFGKTFVVKHYKWGIIMTKYPDMTKIIASPKQRKCRNLFRNAVAWAKTIIADPVQKAEWQKRLKRRNDVYNEAVKAYLLKDKLAKEREDLLTRRVIWNAFKDLPPMAALIGISRAERLLDKTYNRKEYFMAPV
ncbi:MAG: hypothetical protein ABI760_13865 [Ferruginibacter sp.]